MVSNKYFSNSTVTFESSCSRTKTHFRENGAVFVRLGELI